METLVLRFKNKKNYRLIKELASQLEDQKENSGDSKKKLSQKRKPLTEKEFRAMGGIAKGQLISKEHLRSISWKKRDW
jgi:hypothetical protein